MALIHFEPWQKYLNTAGVSVGNDTNTAGAGNLTSSIGVGSPNGPWGENCAIYTSDNAFMEFPLSSMGGGKTLSGSVVIFQTWLWRNGDPTNPAYAPIILEASTSTTGQKHFAIFAGKGGGIIVKGRTSGNVDTAMPWVAYSDRGLEEGQWNYLQVKVDMSNSGSIIVRVNGEELINITGIDFLNDTSSTLYWMRMAGIRSTMYYAETLVMDSSGSTFNDFIDPTHVVAVLPDADGTHTDWTASAGSRFQCVDDTIGNTDAGGTYVTVDPATAPQEITFTHVDVTLTNVEEVHFAGITDTVASDVTTSTVRFLTRSGGTDYDSGADMPVAQTTYRWRNYFWALNPDTGLPWTESEINAAEFGVKVTA